MLVFDFVINRLDCAENVEDPQILVGDPHIFYWRPPYFNWRPPYFNWRPHIFVGNQQKCWASSENMGVSDRIYEGL